MPVEYLKETPSQTAGPYVHIGTLPGYAGLPERPGDAELSRLEGEGPRIVLEGFLYDGGGAPVTDAMLEIYQLDGAGRAIWGRTGADFVSGLWRFDTVLPAAKPPLGEVAQAPHIDLLIFARGINIHLHTRAYLPGSSDALTADPVLARTGARRDTLIARQAEDTVFRFDIALQGARETVFFDM
ncbi:MAG: protocatechuate 3,4-dioxygenase subunit alpha [Pseudomonadota bacterium]